jgi:hypothetical protein
LHIQLTQFYRRLAFKLAQFLTVNLSFFQYVDWFSSNFSITPCIQVWSFASPRTSSGRPGMA